MILKTPPPWEYIDKNVIKKYRVFNKIGRGCYGVVWEVGKYDDEDATPEERLSVDNVLLAMKKVLYAFRDSADAQRTYRELAYLKKFGSHENILGLKEVLFSWDKAHMYLVTDLWDSDLQKALKCQALQPVHRPLISYQVMRALKYMHSAKVMHRDVKPSNILLHRNGDAALADFGWARSSPERVNVEDDSCPMTEYASTRWYRAPEMLLGGRMYTTAVDMWAVGCVVGELHLETPFLPGTSTLDMLTRIEELLGRPLPQDVEAMDAPYAELALEVIPSTPPQKSVEWRLRDQNPSEELLDFLRLLFQYNPLKRMTAVEALAHPYVGSFHNPDGEPEFGGRVELSIPDEERATPSEYLGQIQQLLKGPQKPGVVAFLGKAIAKVGAIAAGDDDLEEEAEHA